MGGRSRVAAQMLAGKGFGHVYNLSGGFSQWQGEAAFGGEDLGVELFTGDEAPEKTLVVAYSLEAGLCDFYLSMIDKVENNDVKSLFQKLSAIEVKHQERIYGAYIALTAISVSREEFEQGIVSDVAEGGLTTDEYISRFQPDLESARDLIDLAMSIEAQALDLYMRAADRIGNPQSKEILIQIADEERMHLTRLGELMDRI